MKKVTLSQTVNQLAKWYKKGTLNFDLPIQRASGQWNLLEKSLLIHSFLTDFIMPHLCFTKYKDEKRKTIHGVVDGKQRCTTAFEFINGEFALHASTPPVDIDDNIVELANKTFKELPKDCQDLIINFQFTIYVLEDATDEDIEEVFARINSGTPLTLIQKSRKEMGSELSKWTKEMTNLPFFQHAISLTVAQARRESDLETLLQSMLLMDAKDEGYEYKAISMSGVTKYCRDIRGNYTDERQNAIQCVVEYLSEAFKEKHKFLKKSNVPMVFITADLALQNDIDPPAYKSFIDCFGSSLCLDYDVNMGSGNIKRVKTEGRLLAMFHEFVKYFKLSEDCGYPIAKKEAAIVAKEIAIAGKKPDVKKETAVADSVVEKETAVDEPVVEKETPVVDAVVKPDAEKESAIAEPAVEKESAVAEPAVGKETAVKSDTKKETAVDEPVVEKESETAKP